MEEPEDGGKCWEGMASGDDTAVGLITSQYSALPAQEQGTRSTTAPVGSTDGTRSIRALNRKIKEKDLKVEGCGR